jgi:tellurite resistance protein
MALGQAAIDNVCLPAVVALHWARLDTSGTWTTELAKNPKKFYARFQKLYKDAFGDGLQLQTNDQELRFNYFPASSSLKVRAKELVVGAKGVPDIKISTDIKKIFLGILGQTCQYLLDPYAGSTNQPAHTINISDTVNTLPGSTWSEAVLERLLGLKEQAGNGPRSIKVKDLATNLGIPIADTKNDFIAFSKLLSQYSLFIIPDVKSGAAPPRIDDQVVIYLASPISGNSQQSAKFNAANIALQLASAVAASDGEFSNSEHEHLLGRLKGWSHLDDNQILHLEANLYYLKFTPAALNSVKLNQIKKKLEHLDQDSRKSIAEFIALVAQVDGAIVADEIKALEKVYKALNLDCGTIYSDLHNGAINNSSLPSSVDSIIVRGLRNDLELDATRIAQLQQDTDRGADLLAAIFSEVDGDEQASVVSSGQLTQAEGPENSGESMILGLDNTLSIFACQLMERLSWSRSDLLIVAKELGLMLDGALESINEASYDKLDLPFSEGDDPVEINPDALSRLNS